MKILLVEDEEKMGEALSELLKMEGYEVTLCTDGTSGYEEASGGLYDILVLDVMLPGKSGLEIAAHIRKCGMEAPVLMLTGTLGIIYATSYREVYKKNQQMLERYIEAYRENGNPKSNQNGKEIPEHGGDDRVFRAADFYSVKLSEDNKTDVDNGKGGYTEEQLIRMAVLAAEKNKTDGFYENMIFRVYEGQYVYLCCFFLL